MLQSFFRRVVLLSGVILSRVEAVGLPRDYNASLHMDEGEMPAILVEDLALLSQVKELKHMKRQSTPRQERGASMGVKFRNLRPNQLEMRWDDGTKEGTYSGVIGGMGRSATMTYQGHRFKFMEKGQEVASFEMEAGKHLYVIEPENEEASVVAEHLAQARAEIDFYHQYQAETGLPWLSFWPRDPPWLNMWPAHVVGQTHVVGTEHGYTDFVLDNQTQPVAAAFQPLALRLTVLSHPPDGPRVFLIDQLISDFECDHLISLGEKVVHQSMVGTGGGFKSKTRTSANGWLRRTASPVLDHIYKRFGDVLGIDHTLLSPRHNAEELQIVRYESSQEYAPHHDFGDDGTPEQRFLTLLLYINLPEKGGATSFPKAFNNRGLQVVPKRGDAVLFYNMLPDGNADDLALHAGMPVLQGTKWVANLWVWDPHR